MGFVTLSLLTLRLLSIMVWHNYREYIVARCEPTVLIKGAVRVVIMLRLDVHRQSIRITTIVRFADNSTIRRETAPNAICSDHVYHDHIPCPNLCRVTYLRKGFLGLL